MGTGSGFATVISEVWAQITNLVGVVEADAVLMIPVGLMFAGAIIGLTKGLIGTRRRRGRG